MHLHLLAGLDIVLGYARARRPRSACRCPHRKGGSPRRSLPRTATVSEESLRISNVACSRACTRVERHRARDRRRSCVQPGGITVPHRTGLSAHCVDAIAAQFRSPGDSAPADAEPNRTRDAARHETRLSPAAPLRSPEFSSSCGSRAACIRDCAAHPPRPSLRRTDVGVEKSRMIALQNSPRCRAAPRYWAWSAPGVRPASKSG